MTTERPISPRSQHVDVASCIAPGATPEECKDLQDAREDTPAWRATWASLRAHGAARTSHAQGGGAVVHYGPRTSGPGCRLGRAEDAVRQYWLWLPGLADRLGGRGRLRRSQSSRRQLGSSSLGSCRTSRRAHEASHTSCAGRGHSTSRAAAHRVQLLAWGTGPAPAHPEPETPARRLQLGEQHGRRCGSMGWRARRVQEAVVHYGPRTASWARREVRAAGPSRPAASG